MAKKRKPQQRLLGWGILAAVLVCIVALFLVSRVLVPGTPPQPAVALTAAAPSSPPAVSAPVETAAVTSSSSGPVVSAAEVAPPSVSIPPPQPQTGVGGVSVIDPAAMDQQTRKDTLLRLINQGIFTAVIATPAPPKVGVTQVFQGLNPSLQQQFIALVYVYINNGKPGTEPLQLIDVTTQKVAGTYSTADGLKLAG